MQDELTTYLGPLTSYKKQGKGILFFRETKCFIEGEFKKDAVYGKADFYRLK